MNLQALTAWPVVQLAEVLKSIENGSRPSGGVDQILTGIPSLGGEHLDTNGGFDFTNIKYVPIEFFEHMSKGVIHKRDILVVKDGATTGKVSFVGDDFPYPSAAINEHVFILRTDPSLILPEFAFFFLFSTWGQVQIQRSYHGGAIGGINQEFVNLVQIPLPPLPEQQRIVTILRPAADLRRQRHKADELAQKLLPALFYEMFGDPDPQRNTVTKTSGKLGDIYQNSGTGGTPSRNRPEFYGGKHYWVKTTELVDDIITETEETLTDAGLASSSARLYPPGTILVAMYGQGQTRGRTGKLAVYAACNQAAAAFPPSDEILPDYLWYWFQLSYERVRGMSRGGPQANLNMKILKDLRIPKPPKEQQQTFVELVEGMKEAHSEQINTGKELHSLFQCISAKVTWAHHPRGVISSAARYL